MKKRAIFFLKLTIMLAVLGTVGWKVWQAWKSASLDAGKAHIQLNWNSLNWGCGLLAILGFTGSMLTSAITWRWLTRQMGDRSPAVPLVGAYTFSQMGKYIPGKVALLLMRIERAGRFGMTPVICTVSTLLENALYMISGGLVGMIAIAHIAEGISADHAQIRGLLWPVSIATVSLVACGCHPKIFYGIINPLLKSPMFERIGMKMEPIPPNRQLKIGTLLFAVAGFIPCWLFGGFALWASACCLHPIPLNGSLWFAGAFSLSVIIGMVSLLPGGAGVREVVLGAAVAMQLLSTGVDHDQAVLFGTVVAVFQRLFQLLVEVLLGLGGAFITRKRGNELPAPTPSA